MEKNFDNMKNALDMERLRVQTPKALKARTFIQFLALIINERVRKTLVETEIGVLKGNKKTWITRYTVPEVYNRLESYTEV